ncbi:MAG: hypothetical protein ACTIDE_03380 [Carnobacterium maltaromaticum]
MIRRNKEFIIIFVIVLFITHFCFPLNPLKMDASELEIFNRAVDSVLSFASLATAFLFFTVSFIPVMAEKSPLFKNLRTDVKMLERIMLDSFLFFLTSIMSLMFVLLDIFQVVVASFVYSIWITLIVVSLYGMLDIFIELFKNINKEIRR